MTNHFTSNRLHGRTALVTGSTSHIGRAIAVAFAAEGAHVIVSGRDATRGNETIAAIQAKGGRADFLPADLDGTSATSHALAEQALHLTGGHLDILVNNAGIFPASGTMTVDDDIVDRIYAVNVKAPLFLVQALAPRMTGNGGGVVINLGSWVARLGIPHGPVYASSKAAIESLTRSWAAEFGPRGLRVNAVSPGVIRPTGPHTDSPADTLMHSTPAGRPGTAEDIADAVLYLASDDARFVHGTVLDVDGGRVGVNTV
ncbi:3-oxoacyl-[acyl-carrier-protein] reductase [Rhodococcus opacus PD630]|uniref:SDR family NAD(P)-dependent oxidoreductase n=1 Tax=Rhodococcus opacus TaxID=37919 RepID=UPI00029CB4B4|nr:SDR family oxidoreductase [Rhodococcus opacus]AHK31897.1 putative oxidoreductase [Rhodococcus opacus PD630]EHI45193.1 3-oxoacyl-[acyl-carrier-protein] reductase [Rhodococcus opacus PD630]UDG94373.1 SDR family oxidoreductase [Rhodococcus opacus PD630]